jgi:polyribonucleotide nucleotidyltransferase
VLAEGLEWSKQWIAASIDLQLDLVKAVEEANGPIQQIPFDTQVDAQDDVVDAVTGAELGETRDAMAIADKTARNDRLDEIEAALIARLVGGDDQPGQFAGRVKEVKAAFRSLQKKVVRTRIVEDGIRIDGRGTSDIRSLSADVNLIPTAHGTGLFQRGETQVLSALTLGMPKMDQLLDNLGDKAKKRYMHHYNMPPHANGETGRVGSPKRREIGHGLLAERALLPVVPSLEEWAYTLRVVSEVLSSNGSTSMGSVCGSTLALMDGGVPIKAPVAGIAMGLVYADGKYTTLTDILGAEDAFGDMDFKVAGTAEFVTALQLDTKIDGLPADVLAQALQQAKEARLEILDVMAKAISEPRAEVGETAPKVVSFEIPIDKIGEVIGPKGKVINAIQAETGADISVDDDGMMGTVTIGSVDKGAIQEAERQIKLILNPPTADIGAVYPGRVVNITKFGAFVNILPGRDGLLHISKIGGGKRIDRVEDVFNLGDEVEVRVDDVDPNGKVSLSLASAVAIPDSATSSGGGDRGGDSGGGSARESVSFEDAFDAEAREQFGDLGPAASSSEGGGGGRGGERRGGRGRR